MSSDSPTRSLITDDDPASADRLRALLERWGHDVRVAGDARTAEVLARVWRPDLVLLELVLPDAAGVSLIPRLRIGDEPPQVVIVSSHATVRVTVDALAAGAASVLEKPVDVPLLQDVLARLSCRRVKADAAVTEPVTELCGMVTRDPRMRALFDMIRLQATMEVIRPSPIRFGYQKATPSSEMGRRYCRPRRMARSLFRTVRIFASSMYVVEFSLKKCRSRLLNEPKPAPNIASRI